MSGNRGVALRGATESGGRSLSATPVWSANPGQRERSVVSAQPGPPRSSRRPERAASLARTSRQTHRRGYLPASPSKLDSDFVFAHPKWYREHFNAALRAAGITDHVRTFHDMRHTALTSLAAAGASPIAVMATAGHGSMQTTKRYLHLAGVTFGQEANALERRMLGELSSELSTNLGAPEHISEGLSDATMRPQTSAS